jgi:D-lactate dehydrogenase
MRTGVGTSSLITGDQASSGARGTRGAKVKVAFFSVKPYDREFLLDANREHSFELVFFEHRLTPETCRLAHGFEAVCVFVNDRLGRDVLTSLARHGTRLIALRCSGLNNVDVHAAEALGVTVARVPAYSPHGVAEHAVALILSLNRKTHRAYNRVRDGNFSLEGLMGFELHGRTIGIIGTGNIGINMVRIMRGFGMNVLASDPSPRPECSSAGGRYVPLEELFAHSDIISVHAPLTPATHHMINAGTLARMKRGVMIINTSRGGIIDTAAVIKALKTGRIGYLGLDVYEEEGDLFFEDLSEEIIQDDVFSRLLTFPNVIITGHQAFFTSNALRNIAETTLQNVSDFRRKGIPSANRVTAPTVKKVPARKPARPAAPCAP